MRTDKGGEGVGEMDCGGAKIVGRADGRSGRSRWLQTRAVSLQSSMRSSFGIDCGMVSWSGGMLWCLEVRS